MERVKMHNYISMPRFLEDYLNVRDIKNKKDYWKTVSLGQQFPLARGLGCFPTLYRARGAL